MMAWVKLDDGFFRNPKIVTISPESKLIYLAGLCYAGAALTDGFIPRNAVRMIAADADVSSPQKRAQELVSAGLWIENPRGYSIHDYLAHNTSASHVLTKREAARQRMEAKRARSSREQSANNPRSSQNVQEPETEVETEVQINEGNGAAAPDPTPTKPPTKRAAQIPQDFSLSEKLIAWASEPKNNFTVEQMESQIPIFVDHYTSKGESRKDWDASFRNWMHKARGYGHLNQPGSLTRMYGGNTEPMERPDLIGPERLAWLKARHEAKQGAGQSEDGGYRASS